uniref:Succinate:cytochrome c oxidoreductase subunit 3 n=1 Tax=Synarthrophyton chejuense TaxID=2485825 RepID=A0A3G3MIH6_9FLOR|nr:succinate:cytochrome c oxidoreductase subunit 3 [Synarthrophyton chejuense]AYR06642.1 succinate:cytochrome c oxidoreductase subunit 3 [Synarthrophyton chejuense]
MFFKNRPLSPHLSIYTSQFTSIYSIWHRITGISLIFFIYFTILIFKLSSFLILNYNVFLILPKIYLWFQNCIFLNIALFFLYHLFNGLRHLFWDLGFNLFVKNLKYTSKISTLILLIFILSTLLKITL